MNAEDLKQLLAVAPGGTTISVVSITLPAPSPPLAAAPDKAGQVEPEWTPAQIVEYVRREHGQEGLKLREWAAMPLGVSMRELKRAVRDGRLECHSKTGGKDHGARMTGPDAMLAFLRGTGRVVEVGPSSGQDAA